MLCTLAFQPALLLLFICQGSILYMFAIQCFLNIFRLQLYGITFVLPCQHFFQTFFNLFALCFAVLLMYLYTSTDGGQCQQLFFNFFKLFFFDSKSCFFFIMVGNFLENSQLIGYNSIISRVIEDNKGILTTWQWCVSIL